MNKRKFLGLLLVFVLCIFTLGGCEKDKGTDGQSGGTKTGVGDVVFKIGKEKCSVAEAKILLVNYQNQYRDVYGVDLWKATNGDNKELEHYIKDLAVSELAEIYLMAHIGADQEMELTEEEQLQVETAADVYYNSLNEAEKKYIGASQKDVIALYEKYAMAQKVYATLTESVSQEVSDDDARVMSVMQIYTTESAQANLAYSKIHGGSNFQTVAASYDKSGATNTTVTRDSVPAAAQEAVFSLSNGEYTTLIEAEDGYYIYYCVNNYEPELTEKNKEKVLAERMEEAVSTTYDAYAASTDSKIYTKTWESVTFNTDESLTTMNFFDVFEEYCTP